MAWKQNSHRTSHLVCQQCLFLQKSTTCIEDTKGISPLKRKEDRLKNVGAMSKNDVQKKKLSNFYIDA